jgi:preprotein translocase subunit SecD
MLAKRILTLFAVGLAACQTSPAPVASESPKSSVTEAPATKPSAATTESPGVKPSTTVQLSGIYPVRKTSADAKTLVPNEGDHVVNLQGTDGTWYMLGVREGVPSSHVAKITKDAPRGGTHYDLQLDDAGTKLLTELTKAQVGKRIAVVVNDVVLIAPETKEPIQSGHVKVSCASSEARCYEAMESLLRAKGGSPQ